MSDDLPPTISPSDPFVILAGIHRFGLAADGADLRDLDATIARLTRERDEAQVAFGLRDAANARADVFREMCIAAEAREAKLREGVGEIARQRLSDEMGQEGRENADWQGTFEMVVRHARAVLAETGGGK